MLVTPGKHKLVNSDQQVILKITCTYWKVLINTIGTSTSFPQQNISPRKSTANVLYLQPTYLNCLVKMSFIHSPSVVNEGIYTVSCGKHFYGNNLTMKPSHGHLLGQTTSGHSYQSYVITITVQALLYNAWITL